MKTNFSFIQFIVLIAISLFASSCNDNDCGCETPPELYVVNQKLENTGISVSIQSVSNGSEQDKLYVGYNDLLLRLVDENGEVVTDAEITLMPKMTMMMESGTHTHGAPVMQPSYVEDLESYKAGIAYLMPSNDMGVWELKVMVKRGEVMDEFTIDTNIAEMSFAGKDGLADGQNMKTLIMKEIEGVKYYFSFYFPNGTAVGSNDVIITAHKKMPMNHEGMGMMRTAEMGDGMMHDEEFMPVTDLSVEIETYMPGMGHGATGTVNPTHTMHGKYEGKAGLNMTGGWQIKLRIKKGEMTIVDSITPESTDYSFYLEF